MSELSVNEFIIEAKKDRKYSICSCGLSSKMPYCDSSHRLYNKEHGTDYKSIKIHTEKNVKLRLSSASWKR